MGDWIALLMMSIPLSADELDGVNLADLEGWDIGMAVDALPN